MDDLVEQLLVGENVAQPVGAQQQVVSADQLPLIQVGPDALLRAQSPGDQVLSGMSAGLFRGDISPGHHVLHHRVVPGEPGDAPLVDVVGPAVADVQQIGGVLHHHHRHHGGAHAEAVGIGTGPAVYRAVGLLRRTGQHRRRRGIRLALGVLEGIHEGLHGNEAGDVARLGAAHTVAHHAHSQVFRRHV